MPPVPPPPLETLVVVACVLDWLVVVVLVLAPPPPDDVSSKVYSGKRQPTMASAIAAPAPVRAKRDIISASLHESRGICLAAAQRHSSCTLDHDSPEPTTTQATMSPGRKPSQRWEMTAGAPAAAWLPYSTMLK